METFAGWVLFICAVAWIVSDRLVVALTWIDERDQRRLAREAADHDEPTREQVEWEAHIAEAIALTEADSEADAEWDRLVFEASVLADIDGLPGGAA